MPAAFSPNQDSLKILLEMGYQRDDCLVALQITENNLEAACTFLINNPNPSVSMPGLQAQLGMSHGG